MCRGHDPFYQASRRSLAYQFTINAPLMCPSFSNFGKILNFQPCFWPNFSSQDANFPNFRSQDPSFFKENPLPRPYFWKPVWHTPTKKKKKKKKNECPPGRVISLWFVWTQPVSPIIENIQSLIRYLGSKDPIMYILHCFIRFHMSRGIWQKGDGTGTWLLSVCKTHWLQYV